MKSLGKKNDWESCQEFFLSLGKQKDYKKLLVESGSMMKVKKNPMKSKFERALEGNIGLETGL